MAPGWLAGGISQPDTSKKAQKKLIKRGYERAAPFECCGGQA